MENFDALWLNEIMDAFTFALTNGFLRVRPWAMNLMFDLIQIALVVGSCVCFLMPHPVLQLYAAIRFGGLVLRMAVLWAILNEWLTITDGFMNSIVWLGLQIGGSTLSYQEFLSPGTVLAYGLNLAGNLHIILINLSDDAWFAPFLWVGYTIAYYGLLFAYSVLSLSILLAVVSFQLVSIFAFLMFPFMTVSFLVFIAWGLFRVLAGEALRLGGLAALMSIMLPFLGTLGIPSGEVDMQSAVMLTIGSGCLVYIIWKGPVQLGGSAWPGSGVVTMGLLAVAGMKRI